MKTAAPLAGVAVLVATWRGLVVGVREGVAFGVAFRQRFGEDLAEAWQGFLAVLAEEAAAAGS